MIIVSDAPARARTAIILLWTSVLITLIQTIVDDFLSNSAAIVAVAVGLAIYGLVIFRASRRHNWARYVLLVWTILATVLYLTSLAADTRSLWDHLVVVASFALDIIAIYMLFTGAVSQWYREKVSA